LLFTKCGSKGCLRNYYRVYFEEEHNIKNELQLKLLKRRKKLWILKCRKNIAWSLHLTNF